MANVSSSSPTLFAVLSGLPVPQALPVVSASTILYTGLALLAGLLVLEQGLYRVKKGNLPGAKWTIPIIGKFADSLNPTLENYLKGWAQGPLSVVSVFNIFIVLAADTDYTRKILNSPQYAEPCVVASAKTILEPDNWVFLDGKAHVDYRRILNTLFTRKALGTYLQLQDQIARQQFARWMAEAKADPSPKSIMMPVRRLNMMTSLRVFCGSHIPDHAAEEILDKYWQITKALQLVNFPLALPGTDVYRAVQARKATMKWLLRAAASSKRAMAAGGEPDCLLDAWVCELAAAEKAGKRERAYTDREMAMVVLSFLFASQDAMSSGLIYMFQHLADHPHALDKVREEQLRVRAGDAARPLTLDLLDEMPYIKACVKESLREKPPVTMVPYKARKPFPLTATYTAPAGSMVIPCLYPSLKDPEAYPNPDAFEPERWLDPAGPANAAPHKFLVFGHGPHRCIGIEYATMHMACVLGTASMLMDWVHHRTPDSDKTQLIATLFPKDGCLMTFSPRE